MINLKSKRQIDNEKNDFTPVSFGWFCLEFYSGGLRLLPVRFWCGLFVVVRLLI